MPFSPAIRLACVLLLSAPCLPAELAWHEFDVSDATPAKIALQGAEVQVAQRGEEDAAFPEDQLTIKFTRREGGGSKERWFTSSYGQGAVAMEGRWLLLRYGLGRGTFAREEHVRIFQIAKDGTLEEMADVKVSHCVSVPGSKSSDPVCAEYTIATESSATTLSVRFIPPQIPGVELPEKRLEFGPPASKPSPQGAK